MSTLNNQTELSGMLGESVSVRKVNGRVVLTNRPKRKRGPLSDKQADAREKFLEASNYASRQVQQEESKALYATGIKTKKQTAYTVALTDYFIAPEVKSIDTLDYHGAIGDSIRIKAVDDFMVTRVKIVITNAAGAIIEQGDAEQDMEKVHFWQYKASVVNPPTASGLAGTKILAVAFDRPGNTGTDEVVL